VTGNLALTAIAVAAHDRPSALRHLSAIVTFFTAVCLGVLIVRAFTAFSLPRLLSTVRGIETILIVAASLALASGMGHGAEVFVIFVSLGLGLQNGAFRRVAGVNVHTTYLTGMITSLTSAEEEYAFEVVPSAIRDTDQKISLLWGIWIAFVLGAVAGAAMVFHFKALGMLGAVLVWIALELREVQSCLRQSGRVNALPG
jgi:uncharacterized membrane protein YoaK (UPF0700 family)